MTHPATILDALETEQHREGPFVIDRPGPVDHYVRTEGICLSRGELQLALDYAYRVMAQDPN